MGTVFHAKRLADGIQVAIKLTHSQDPYFLERFKLECETLAGLQHPGISRYIEHGHVDGQPYLTLEWLGDGSLADRLATGPLPPLAALATTVAVADALQFMHQKGLIHRDIKPANILFRGNEPVLADLGIVRVAWSQLTQAGTILGTPEYMSPEQIQGHEIDGRSDFYSLGVMLYEMLTGTVPFRTNDNIETCKLHLLANPPPLRDSLEWLQRLTTAMMTKSREHRATGPLRIRNEIQDILEADDDRLVSLALTERQNASFLLGQIYASRFPQLPNYITLRPAGHGGMATVYFAISIKLNRRVALKVLGKFSKGRQQDEARFKREATTLAKINHDHVCRIYDSGIAAEQAYLVLEWLSTGSLAERIVAGCTPAEALTWILQISDALRVAHELRIIHRDLKPANVMLRNGVAVLTDFGIARDLGSSLSATGTVLGTPAYMSPEQIQGQKVGPGSDIYSLGILLYELLIGRTPYTGETPAEVAMQHLVAPIPVLPKDYSDLQPLLNRLLTKNPEQRIADCSTLSHELRRTIRESEALQRLLRNRSEAVSAQLNRLGVSLEWKPDGSLQGRTRRQWRRLQRWLATRPKTHRIAAATIAATIASATFGYLVIEQRNQTIIASAELDAGTRTALSVLEAEFIRSIEAGRLFEPDSESAARFLIDMRSVQRNADITVRAEGRFLDAVAARALTLDQQDPDAADTLISGTEALFPEERIAGLQRQLSEIRLQREYETSLASLLSRLQDAADAVRIGTLITEAEATELGPLRPQLIRAMRGRITGEFDRLLAAGELTVAQDWQQQLERIDPAAGTRALQRLRLAEVDAEVRRLREDLPDWQLADLRGLATAAGVLQRIEDLGGEVNADREKWQAALERMLEFELANQRYDEILGTTEAFADQLSARGQELLASVQQAKAQRDLQESLGTVALRITPWGRILNVRDARGASVDLSRAISNRGDLRLPAGNYRLVIEDGWSRAQTSLDVQIKAGETTPLAHRFGEIDPDRYAELAGIAP